jgi:hypothetical protein
MGTTVRSRWLKAALFASLSLGPISCGGSSNSSNSSSLAVGSIQPSPFFAYKPTPFTLIGDGFLHRWKLGSAVTVNFGTTEGTPFANGTSAQAAVPGTVISNTQIAGTSPTTNSTGGWRCIVAVSDANGDSYGIVASTAAIARFVGLTVGTFDPQVIRSDVATSFDVTGLAFQPVGGQATVRFTTALPAFPGSSNVLDVIVDVISPIVVRGVTPTFPLATAAPTFVTVILHQEPGAPSATSPAILATFAPPPPIPVVVGGVTPAMPIDVATLFTVTGSGFLGAGGDPDVAVTFTASAGTPFRQGTASTISVAGTATTDGIVGGTSPLGTSLSNFTAFVTVTRTDGIAGTSATAIAQFLAPLPSVTALTPDAMPSTLATAFVITGANLPTGQTATVRFRAVSGTPFAGGTSASASVIANVTSTIQINGFSPVSVTTEPFLCDVDVILQSGTELNMGPECMFEPPPGPALCTVTNLNDAGPGSLRDTILNATPDCVIVFDASLSGTVSVASTLVVPHDVRILGPGADVIRVGGQNGDYPVFTIQPGAPDTTIALLGIRGSKHTGDGGGCLVWGGLTLVRCELSFHEITGNGGAAFVGAGGTLTLRECTIHDCYAEGMGGVVFVSGGGTAHVIGCNLHDSTGVDGGGVLAVASLGTLDAVNCSMSNSLSYIDGGGILVRSGATVSLLHCTLTDNVAVGHGGGVQIDGGLFTATSCIFSRDFAGESSPEISHAGGTNTTTFSLVFVGTGSGLSHGVAGNLVGTASAPIDPRLRSLDQNGGPTRTMMPVPSSPVIDAGNLATCPPTDQRRVARPIGAGCDMGACEADLSL